MPKTSSIAYALGLLIVVGISPALAGNPTDTKRPWTIMVYGAVDNSADGPLIAFLDQVRRAVDNDPGIELLLFIDRSQKHPKKATYLGDDFTTTRLYRLRKDSVERLTGGHQLPE